MHNVTNRILGTVLVCAALLTPASAQTRDHQQTVDKVGQLCILTTSEAVTWLPIHPTTWQTSTHDGGRTCVVATSSTGQVVVLAIHGSEAGKPPNVERFIITIGGGKPDPGPTPPPTPPDIPNAMGVGKVAYAEAVKVGDVEGCKQLATIWNGAAKWLEAKDGTEAEIQTAIEWLEKQHNERLSAAWEPWRTAMSEAFDKAWKDWTAADWVKAYREVVAALQVVTR